MLVTSEIDWSKVGHSVVDKKYNQHHLRLYFSNLNGNAIMNQDEMTLTIMYIDQEKQVKCLFLILPCLPNSTL